MLTLGSLFDGIGGWLISAKRNGIRPVWASEIEPFPIAVTKHHFPEVLHLGSVTDIKGDEIEPVDIITSGSPCQDLSVAGNQKGFKGGRSGLFFDSVRVVREMRAATGGKFPRFYVWENVPGAFSSNKGRDFLAVIESLTETIVPMPASGKWANAGMVRSRRCDIAWRVLDAQHWGVPQRRKRIFLVADFGAVGERRPEVFFKPEGLPGHYSQGEGTGKGAAEAADGCFALAGNTIERKPGNGGNGRGFQPDLSYTLTGMDRHAVAIRERCGCEGGGKGLLYGDDLAHTLNTGKDQFICGFNAQASKTQHIGFKAEQSPALDTSKVPGVVSYDMTHADDVIRENRTDKIHTLNHRMGTGGNQVPVVQTFSDVASTLRAGAGAPKHLSDVQGRLVNAGAVRRLLPIECERLQGLPEVISFLDFNFKNLTLEFKSCLDLQKEPVLNVAEKCLKLQRTVGIVERIRLRELVRYAEKNTFIKHQQKNKPVLVIAHTNLGDLVAEKHRIKKSRSNAFSAESRSLSLHQKITTLLVHSIVGISSSKEKIMLDGKEESLLKGKILTIHGNGKIVLNGFGKEMAQSAKDAGSIKKMMKKLLRHITSSHSQIKQLELTLITLFFYVVSAITGFTQGKTPIRTLLEIHSGYTDIPHKSCSDSARYKAIGNGMAQPCSDFVMSVVKRMAG